MRGAFCFWRLPQTSCGRKKSTPGRTSKPSVLTRHEKTLQEKPNELCEISAELREISAAKLGRDVNSPAPAPRAGSRLHYGCGPHRHSCRNSAHSETIFAQSGAGNCKCAANDSEPRVVWLSYSASIHRRHRRPHRDRRARALCVAANNPQYGDRNSWGGPERP